MPMSLRIASNRRGYVLAPRRQRGVGLIEVLVAVLILSIGLLGITLVQTRALSSNNSAMGRSMAVVASYSILEAMRSDRANAVAATLPYNTTVTANSCPTDTSTLAKLQLNAWCAELRSRFSAEATTLGIVNCNTTGICVITIQFDDSRGGTGLGSSATEQVVTRAAL